MLNEIHQSAANKRTHTMLCGGDVVKFFIVEPEDMGSNPGPIVRNSLYLLVPQSPYLPELAEVNID